MDATYNNVNLINDALPKGGFLVLASDFQGVYALFSVLSKGNLQRSIPGCTQPFTLHIKQQLLKRIVIVLENM